MLAIEEMCAQDMLCEYEQSVLDPDDAADNMLDILEGDDNSGVNIDLDEDDD